MLPMESEANRIRTETATAFAQAIVTIRIPPCTLASRKSAMDSTTIARMVSTREVALFALIQTPALRMFVEEQQAVRIRRFLPP